VEKVSLLSKLFLSQLETNHVIHELDSSQKLKTDVVLAESDKIIINIQGFQK